MKEREREREREREDITFDDGGLCKDESETKPRWKPLTIAQSISMNGRRWRMLKEGARFIT